MRPESSELLSHQGGAPEQAMLLGGIETISGWLRGSAHRAVLAGSLFGSVAACGDAGDAKVSSPAVPDAGVAGSAGTGNRAGFGGEAGVASSAGNGGAGGSGVDGGVETGGAGGSEKDGGGGAGSVFGGDGSIDVGSGGTSGVGGEAGRAGAGGMGGEVGENPCTRELEVSHPHEKMEAVACRRGPLGEECEPIDGTSTWSDDQPETPTVQNPYKKSCLGPETFQIVQVTHSPAVGNPIYAPEDVTFKNPLYNCDIRVQLFFPESPELDEGPDFNVRVYAVPEYDRHGFSSEQEARRVVQNVFVAPEERTEEVYEFPLVLPGAPSDGHCIKSPPAGTLNCAFWLIYDLDGDPDIATFWDPAVNECGRVNIVVVEDAATVDGGTSDGGA